MKPQIKSWQLSLCIFLWFFSGSSLPAQNDWTKYESNPIIDAGANHSRESRASDVKITVYNISGQKTTVLLNAHRPAGYHEVTFHAGNLASGIYYYKMTAGNDLQIRKMLLTK